VANIFQSSPVLIVHPRNITVTEEGADLLIKRKWSVWSGLGNMAVAAFILWFAYLMVTTTKWPPAFTLEAGKRALFESVLTFLIPIVLLGIGGYLLVKGLYMVLNSTRLRINSTQVSSQHYPLPWGGKYFPAQDIQQVFVTKHRNLISRTNRRTGRTQDTYSYSVDLRMANGATSPLLRDLPNSREAWFIQEQVQKHLHLEPAPVPEE
jgi:hypothetical protein